MVCASVDTVMKQHSAYSELHMPFSHSIPFPVSFIVDVLAVFLTKQLSSALLGAAQIWFSQCKKAYKKQLPPKLPHFPGSQTPTSEKTSNEDV